ncbi:hypothetical protein [Streptomyces sp. SID8378]|uniref:hypothetical protein n=1 Tax=Streptomyces sp. SID8378 TaxID=2690358 RepID=UPI000B66821D|nr:hypothetical protein [Streptomyces sp. SID8378]SNB88362.1 hypothetical protein SAMN02745831_04638 [Streptomyces sp. PgraA7]
MAAVAGHALGAALAVGCHLGQFRQGLVGPRGGGRQRGDVDRIVGGRQLIGVQGAFAGCGDDRGAVRPVRVGAYDGVLETVRGGAAIAVRVASLLVSASEDIALLDRPPYVHTVRRRITRLMRALNAETRFQAGVQAALRVWFTG